MIQLDFIDRVKEVLNTDYGFELEREVSLPDGRKFNFDLGDVKNKVIVEIRPSSKSFEVEFVSQEIAPSAIEAVAVFGPKVRFYYVFEESLYSNDVSELEDLIVLNQEVEVFILEGSYIDIFFNRKAENPQTSVPEEFFDPNTSGSKYSDKKFQHIETPEDIEGNFKSQEQNLKKFSTRKTIVQEWLTSLEHQKKSFYVAASFWGNNDYTMSFLTSNSWFYESDVELPFSINEVKKGSVIFLRGQEDASIREDQLGIRAVGIVANHGTSGESLSVNWVLTDLLYHSNKLSNYKRHAIDIVSIKDLETILTTFSEEHFNSIKEGLETISTLSSIPTIAGLISDADIGTDHLDITKDVSAFARVMAARSFLPPLAIALFGKWGSGKSFFMRKLRDEIDLLSENVEGGPFCRGIAQIHFNAWSYMDSNLWASMVSRIFEGLQQYISNDTKAKDLKKKVEATLTNNLSIVNEGLEKLKSEKVKVDKKLMNLKTEKEKEEEGLKNKLKELKNDTLIAALKQVDEEFDVEAKIKNAASNNVDIKDNIDILSEIVPRKYWKTADGFYQESKSVTSFLKLFFKKGKRWENISWMFIIVAIVVSVPVMIKLISQLVLKTDYSLSAEFWTTLTIIFTLFARGIKTYEKMQPAVTAFWGIKTDYDKKKEEATLSYHDRQRLTTIKIEEHRNKLATISMDIAKKTHKQNELAYRLENTLSTEALYSFIERKSESKSYSMHLGIVSTIRKDFDVMSELFVDHEAEVRKVDKKETSAFRGLFKRPLERIILYIDDLDRCTEERVVEVLEAVNLLMAFPLFVVVMGVDPRWVKNALYKRHRLQFADVDDEDDVDLISPSAYLEKIFQVPFNLKSASDTSVKNMLKKLAETEPVLPKFEAIEKSENIVSKTSSGGNIEDSNVGSQVDPPKIPVYPTGNEPPEDQIIKKQPLDIKEAFASLSFTEDEVKLIQKMSRIVGSSPRAIKRFVNIFRIVKAHEDYPNDMPTNETKVVLFLLALPLGKYKSYYGEFIKQLSATNSEENELTAFLDFIKEDSNSSLEGDLVKDVFGLFGDLDKGELNTTFKVFKTHYPLIKRFSYASG